MTPLPPARSFNWRCAFGLHPWEKWEPTIVVTIYNPGLPSLSVEREAKGQKRTCLRCGREQLRTL